MCIYMWVSFKRPAIYFLEAATSKEQTNLPTFMGFIQPWHFIKELAE